MYDLSDDFPIPPGPGRPCEYPFHQMAVGQSFFAAKKKVVSAARMHGRNHGGKFTSRAVTENGVNGFRIWRIA